MHNKFFALLLVLALALSLCACGGKAPAAPAEESAEAPAPAPETAQSEESPAESEASEPETDLIPALPDAGLHAAEEKPAENAEIARRLELAKSYVDKDVQDLIDELGEPLERSYAPSCLGDGEDGELRYEGFTVYTYREDGVETVTDVK